MQPDVGNIEQVANWVDGLLESMASDQAPSPIINNDTWQPPAGLLDQASTWALTDPTKPLAGIQPACIMTGRGAVIEQGIAVKHGSAPTEEADDPTKMEFSWVEVDKPLISEDGWGVAVEQTPLPAPGGSNDFRVSMHLNPPFLLWAAQRKWLWHRKWMIPAVRVDVRCRKVPPNRRLYVMLTAGTLREDSPVLHDVGLNGERGECQRRLELDANGHGTAHFSHLHFKYTSFNTGQRPFHLGVIILADPPDTDAAVPSLGGERYSPLAQASSMQVATPNELIAPMNGGPDSEHMVIDVVDAPADTATAAGAPNGAAAGAPTPFAQPAGQGKGPRTALLCMRSDPVNVDARKRSTRERAMANDDVRLVQRHHTVQNNSVQKAKLGQTTRGGGRAGPHQTSAQLPQQSSLGQGGASNDMSGWLRQLFTGGSSMPVGVGDTPGMGRNDMSLLGITRSSSVDSSLSNASTRLGVGGKICHKIPGPSDAVVELRGSDAVMLNVLSAGAFGYTPFELVGHPIFAIAHPHERENLMFALQTLQRMEEIAHVSNPVATPRSAIRVVHRVVTGIGQSRAISTVFADSTISMERSPNGQRQMLMRSREATPEAAAAGFCMELS